MKIPKFFQRFPTADEWILAAGFSLIIAGIASAILGAPVMK